MDSQDLNVGVELFSSKYEWGMALRSSDGDTWQLRNDVFAE